MLAEFKVKNYRSFKDEQILSLVALKNKEILGNCFTASAADSIELLKSAVIYGQNASGKSNLIRALFSLQKIVKTSSQMGTGDTFPIEPFMFYKPNQTLPCEFEVSFIFEEKKYIYGVSVTEDYIDSEYLYFYPKKAKHIIFERSHKKDQNYPDIYMNPKYIPGLRRQEFLQKDTPPYKLFLTQLDQNNNAYAQNVIKWFNHLTILPPRQRLEPISTINLMKTDSNFQRFLNEFMQAGDFGGIEEIKAALIESPDQLELMMQKFPEEVRLKFKDELKEKKIIIPVIQSKHQIVNEDKTTDAIWFDFEEESTGTQSIFSMLHLIYKALKQPSVIFMDEMAAYLHNNLLRQVIQLLHSADNVGSQVVFTTHNTSILNNVEGLFRRDQIWFTDRKSDGGTSLYSLADISVRKDASFERDYLVGRYGAVPIFDKMPSVEKRD